MEDMEYQQVSKDSGGSCTNHGQCGMGEACINGKCVDPETEVPSATVIRSKDVVNSYKNYFKLLWKIAKP